MSLDPAAIAELDEAAWYERGYRGRAAPQLTVRAIATGLVLGFLLAFANVYVGLKTGWFFGMAMVASLGGFAVWRALVTARLARTSLTLLEASCLQSTASSAAYATGNMVVGVIPAMLLVSVNADAPGGIQRSSSVLAIWIACVAALGVALAIPLKRQLINRERLPFPSGTAAAMLLHRLYAGDGRARSGLLFGSLLAGAVVPVLRDVRDHAVIAARSAIFDWLPALTIRGTAYPLSAAGIALEHSVVAAAAGAFVGLRTASWLVIGGLVTAVVLGPRGAEAGVVTALDHAWLDVGIWAGAPLLVAAAAVGIVGQWRTIARAFRRADAGEASRGIEIPRAWFAVGFAACATCCVTIAYVSFDVPVALGGLAVAATIAVAVVACRVTGETDITPGAALAKLVQLGAGAVHPLHPTTGLATAGMAHAASTASADLLNDLKTGHLLGADPRRQLIAQAIGIVAGTTASVIAYFVLIPDARALLDHDAVFAAPGAHQLHAIAELLQHGLASLHPLQRGLVALGAGAGLLLAIVERLAPARVRRWLPSAAGLGLGLLLPVATSFAILLGAALAALLAARDRGAHRVWPIAAGLLAGESIAGVLVALIDQIAR